MTNNDLAQIVDTNDEWIRSRTGIGESRIQVDCSKTLETFKKEGFGWEIPPAARLIEGFSGLFT